MNAGNYFSRLFFAVVFLGVSLSSSRGALIEEGFDGFNGGTRPAGWTFVGCAQDTDTYTSPGDYGAAAPSLKLDATGDAITTAAFSDPDWLRFWIKGQGTDATSSLLIEEYYNSWTSLTQIAALPTLGTTIGDLVLNPSTSQVRFTFNQVTGNLAFDDILITSLLKTPTPLPTATPPPTTVPTATPPATRTPSPTPTSAVTATPTPTPVGYKTPTPPPTPVSHQESLTICTANIMAFKYRYGDPAARIFQGLNPDIVSVQEFSVQSTYSGVRQWVDTAFGADFDYYIEDAGAANGVISRWTILTAGTWEDVGHESLGRNFAWAVIDIPGDKDLQIVSVHLKAGNTTSDRLIREDQAYQLKDYMEAGFDMQSHYAVLAGDINAFSRSPAAEPCLAVFATFLDYNDYIPMDREGNDNTNSTTPRTYPYDWIMPNNLLDDLTITTNVGQAYTSFQTFTAGHVFDDHIFVPLDAVPPIQYDDLYYPGITHKPVTKTFHVTAHEIVVDEDFTGFTEGVRPAGWTFLYCNQNNDTYVNPDYCGQSPPSIKLDTDGAQITTDVLYDAASLQFWMRGAAADVTTSLLVEDHYDGEWYPLAEFTHIPNTAAGVTVGPLNLYNPTDRVRFTMNKAPSGGNIALDDIIIRGNPSLATPTPVDYQTPTPTPTPTAPPTATVTPGDYKTPTPTPSLPPTPPPTSTPTVPPTPPPTPVPTLTPAGPTPTPVNLVLEYSTYLGGTGKDYTRGVEIVSGSIYLVGYTRSSNFPAANAYQPGNAGNYDIFLTKFSSDGQSLAYSSYLGGASADYANALAVDSSGQAYVTGTTYSYNFPAVNAYQSSRSGSSDAFLAKFSSGGTDLLYSTYLGGNENDRSYGIFVVNDTPYLAGYTNSGDFPVVGAYQSTHGGTPGGDYDAFVTRFAADGQSLLYSSYFGGVDQDEGLAVAVSGGEIYLAGLTYSGDFPTAAAYQPAMAGGYDAYLARFSSGGTSLVFSTYLGGNDADSAAGVGLDSAGNVYLAGDTFSTDFPTAAAYKGSISGSSDTFVAKFSPDGSSLLYSTYLGGSDLEECHGLRVDDGRAAVAGATKSGNFPVVNAYQSSSGGDWDAYLARFNASGSALEYSSYLGGAGVDVARALAVESPDVVIGGYTKSSNFPVLNAYQSSRKGDYEAFAARFNFPADFPSPTPSVTPTPRVITPTPTPSVTPTPRVITPTPTPVICTRLDEGFDNFDTGARPAGWTFAGCGENWDTYTAPGSYGYLSPSIKLDNTGDSIVSAGFSDGEWLQFWVKGQGTDLSSSLLIEEYYSPSWTSLTSISGLPTAGAVLTGLPLDPAASRIRFTYSKSLGDLALDDVLVKCLLSPTPTAAPTLPPSPPPTATPSPPPSATPSPSPTFSSTPTPTPAATSTPTPAPTATPSPVPSASPTPAICTRIDEGFDGFDTGARPAGWIFTGCGLDGDTYTSPGDFGRLSPSLKLDNSGDRVASASFLPGEWLQFWVKGQGTDLSSSLLVEQYSADWTEITDIFHLPLAGTVLTGLALNPSSSQIRFTYEKSLGDLALDDVLIKCLITPTPPPSATATASPPATATPTPAPTPSPTPDNYNYYLLLDYSTYLGGSGADRGRDIAVDSANCAHLVGTSYSRNFPTSFAFQSALSGGTDTVIAKFSADGGSLLYATYLGGELEDIGLSLALDPDGGALVAGYTSSPNFPTFNPYQASPGGGEYDAFLAKLSPDGGSLVFSTYLGGSGPDYGISIAVDGVGHPYLTGFTQSGDFPTRNAYQPAHAGTSFLDIFVSKFSSDGSALIYSTYLGGAAADRAREIAVDDTGAAYITGHTESDDFPTASPFQAAFGGGLEDAFVSKLSAAGSSLVYSSYLGGLSREQGEGIAVNPAGEAYVAGSTLSPDFPLQDAFQPALAGGTSYGDAFVSRVSADGSALIYSTYLGGSGEDRGRRGIALDGDNYIYLAGWTTSTDFPLYRPYQPAFGGGDRDAFAVSFYPSGTALAYSTFLGGSGNDSAVGAALDSSGRFYLTGQTSSPDFPVINAYQAAPGGGGDDFFISRIEKFGHLTTPTPSPSLTPPPTATSTPRPPTTPTPVSTATPTPTPAGYQTPPPTVSPSPTPAVQPTAPHLVVDWDDYNGDGTSDIAVYDPATGGWDIRGVTSGLVWGGGPGDLPAPGDYTGDGTADLGYFDRFRGEWNVIRTTGEVITTGVVWGAWGDLPVPGDYNGDGSADFAVWRPSDGRWRIRDITNVWYGQAEGMYPVPGDYDGDRTTDIAMVYPATGIWYVRGIRNRAWWRSGDAIARPMDFSGDGTTELAFYRPSTGWWYIRRLAGPAAEFTARRWGLPARGDIPVVGDFDGDGAADLTTFRPAVGRWWILYSSRPYNYVDFSAQSTETAITGATSY